VPWTVDPGVLPVLFWASPLDGCWAPDELFNSSLPRSGERARRIAAAVAAALVPVPDPPDPVAVEDPAAVAGLVDVARVLAVLLRVPVPAPVELPPPLPLTVGTAGFASDPLLVLG